MPSWRSNWCPWMTTPKDTQDDGQQVPRPPKASHPKIPKRRRKEAPPAKPRVLSDLFQGDKIDKYTSIGYTGGWSQEGEQKWITTPSTPVAAYSPVKAAQLPLRGLRAPARGLPAARSKLPWNSHLSDPQTTAARVLQANLVQQHESFNLMQTKDATLFSPPGAWERRLQEETLGGGSSMRPSDSSKALQMQGGFTLSRTAGQAPPNRTGGRRDGTGFSHSLLGASPNGKLGARATIVAPGVAERMYDGYTGKYAGLNDRNPVGTVIHTTKFGSAVKEGSVPKQRNAVTGTRTLAGCSNSLFRSANMQAAHIVQPSKSIPRPYDPHCILGPNDQSGALQCLGMFPDFKFLVRTFNEREQQQE